MTSRGIAPKFPLPQPENTYPPSVLVEAFFTRQDPELHLQVSQGAGDIQNPKQDPLAFDLYREVQPVASEFTEDGDPCMFLSIAVPHEESDQSVRIVVGSEYHDETQKVMLSIDEVGWIQRVALLCRSILMMLEDRKIRPKWGDSLALSVQPLQGASYFPFYEAADVFMELHTPKNRLTPSPDPADVVLWHPPQVSWLPLQKPPVTGAVGPLLRELARIEDRQGVPAPAEYIALADKAAVVDQQGLLSTNSERLHTALLLSTSEQRHHLQRARALLNAILSIEPEMQEAIDIKKSVESSLSWLDK